MQLDAFAAAALEELRAAGLLRQLRSVAGPQGPRIVVDGHEVVNFSSNDYLGLANDPLLREAAVRAIERYGVVAGASRLVCGNLAPYEELEARLAAFKGKEAAVVFGSGYAANVGTICALVGKGDTVILDKLDHASIVDGARQSGATIRVYPHGDLNKLEKLLKQSRTGVSPVPSLKAGEVGQAGRLSYSGHTLIVTETVFSMDGDLAPLREIVELKERYGAWLMIDEAHATGLYGKRRRGVAEALGVEDRVDVTVGTLSKALGCVGGFVCGSRALVDLLVNRARSLIYSTALPPAMVAAASAAVEFVMGGGGEARCGELWRRVRELRGGLGEQSRSGVPPDQSSEMSSPIIPLLLGDEARAVECSQRLFERGFFAPAIRYPTVARGAARLRLTVTAAHTSEQAKLLIKALSESDC
ncbi:MAG: aminotransferase class I/II-fold pyridoxal phosphate-dependent enzyme [Verrucomicrobia bacterium]|nr:aminotransferase class I/II-fold pyridoxal phosphate-dependent enzyme [Verrucomicrobiota bacterium]